MKPLEPFHNIQDLKKKVEDMLEAFPCLTEQSALTLTIMWLQARATDDLASAIHHPDIENRESLVGYLIKNAK